jgi:peroxin-4
LLPQTGEICLDLLKDRWTPAYTIEKTLEAIWGLLQEGGGEVDSPLNVDLAALMRQGDAVGAAGLVRYWTEEERYSGD